MPKEDYIDKAERIMKEFSEKEYISTSKIRDLMTQVSELYNDIILDTNETLLPKYVDAIRHLKVKMIYDAGRDRQEGLRKEEVGNPKLKDGKLTYFFRETGLLDMVEQIGDSREKFLDYCKYFEALVAYHKFYGGK